MNEPIYLDNAATTKMNENVLQVMMPYLTSYYGNPSSIHSYGRETRIAVEQARKTIAALLSVKPSTIIFTSGGTESNNTAIATAIRDLHCNHIITSKIEHHAVLHTIEHYAAEYKIEISYLKLNEDGSINSRDLRKLLKVYAAQEKKCLVTLMNANNETGQITDIKSIAAICKEHNAIYHADCVQTIGHYPLNLLETGVDFASASAHKFHGPKGIGILYKKEEIQIKPLIYGGGHERGYRAGTENVASIVGMAKAVQESYDNFLKDSGYIKDLKQYLKNLIRRDFPDCIINSRDNSLYSVLSVSFRKTENSESLFLNLDKNGICVSGGSACSGGGVSHVMSALGRAADFITVRFSFSKYNKKEELKKVADEIQHSLQPVSKLSTI
jgi:cysteine desulfurase